MSAVDARTVLITNRRGLHARASAKFVTLAVGPAGRGARSRRTASSVTGTSIMGLMMLGAAMGDTITISADGRRRRGGGRGAVRAGRGQVRRGLTDRAVAQLHDARHDQPHMPRNHRFSNPLSSAQRCATSGTAATRGLFLAEGLRILTEAREAGRLPRDLFFAADSAGPSAGRTRWSTRRRGGGRRGDRDDARHPVQAVGQGQSAGGRRRVRRIRRDARRARPHDARRSGWSPSGCAIRAISARSCAPAMRSARAG